MSGRNPRAVMLCLLPGGEGVHVTPLALLTCSTCLDGATFMASQSNAAQVGSLSHLLEIGEGLAT